MSTDPPFAVRVARPDEWVVLAPIERASGELFRGSAAPELADGDVVPDEVAQRYAREHRVFVADLPDTGIVGFLAWHVERDESCLGVAQVSVLPDHAGRGIGTALLERTISVARERGFAHVTLNTQRNVAWNEPWYRSLGFESVDPDDWAPFMRDVVDRQTEAGLDWSTRTWMRLPLR